MSEVAVCDGVVPFNLVHIVNILQKGGNPLQAIGQLNRDRVKVHSARLLEIGELRDLKSVEHHLPTDSPGAQGWRLPVVFLKTNVVVVEVNSDVPQAAKVDVLNILRWWF